MTAFFALNQYPFATLVYFLFIWPFVSLLIIALASTAAHHRALWESPRVVWPSPLVPAMTTVAGFVIFCLIRFGLPGVFVEFRLGPPSTQYASLSGLLVAKPLAEHYQQLTKLLDNVLRPDQTVLAGPDSPDVYFFTGRRNPTPVMFEMFAAPHDQAATLRRLAQRDEIGAVIFNMAPGFSKPWPADVGRPLVQHMRRQTQIDRFIVYYDRTD